MVSVIKEINFINEWLINYHDDNIFNSDGTINRNYNSFKKTGLIASIFEDYWQAVYKNNKELIDKYRPNVNIEINKIIDCYNKDLGCSAYICPECDELVFIGHTCKSRMCSSCGYKYKNERVESILQSAVRCNHRQIVFTIPKELRKYFFFPFEDRINLLFKAVNLTIESILNKSYKKDKQGILKEYNSKIKYTPGFFAFLHTFGRDLKWNPHIHVLIAELKVKENGYQKWNYFNYDALSKRFQKVLLDLLNKEIGESFKEEKNYHIKIIKRGSMYMLNLKNLKILKMALNILLDIVVEFL